MANKLRWVAIFSLLLLASVAFFQLAMLPNRCMSLVMVGRKGIRGQEMRAAKHCLKRVDEAVVTYLTRVQNPRQVLQDSGYHGRTVREAKVDETESENGGSRMTYRKRKLEMNFKSKRAIPGGPNGQHHMSNGTYINSN